MALDLPDEARSALVEWRQGALARRDDLRFPAPDALHVTLAFLGHRPEAEIPRIASTAFGSLGALSPARLRATGVRPVPPRRPRLLAVDLEDEGGGAAAIQASVSGALAQAGLFEPERRPFWPHVTIARARGRRPAGPLVRTPPPAEPFVAGVVTLYRSTLRREGARYDALERTQVGGR